MIGFAFLILAGIYEVYALLFDKQTISEFIWRFTENKYFRALFFFTWIWLTVHLLFPDFFQ